MKKQAAKIWRTAGFILLSAMIFIMKTNIVYASQQQKLEETPFVKGIIQLAKDGLGILMVVEPTIAFLYVGLQLFMMKFGEEDESRARKKKIKTVGIATAVIFSVTAIGNIIVSYFNTAK